MNWFKKKSKKVIKTRAVSKNIGRVVIQITLSDKRQFNIEIFGEFYNHVYKSSYISEIRPAKEMADRYMRGLGIYPQNFKSITEEYFLGCPEHACIKYIEDYYKDYEECYYEEQ